MIASLSCTIVCNNAHICFFLFQLQKLMLPPAAQSQAVLMLPPQIPAVVDVPFFGCTTAVQGIPKRHVKCVIATQWPRACIDGLQHAFAFLLRLSTMSKETSLIGSSSEYNGSHMDSWADKDCLKFLCATWSWTLRHPGRRSTPCESLFTLGVQPDSFTLLMNKICLRISFEIFQYHILSPMCSKYSKDNIAVNNKFLYVLVLFFFPELCFFFTSARGHPDKLT